MNINNNSPNYLGIIFPRKSAILDKEGLFNVIICMDKRQFNKKSPSHARSTCANRIWLQTNQLQRTSGPDHPAENVQMDAFDSKAFKLQPLLLIFISGTLAELNDEGSQGRQKFCVSSFTMRQPFYIFCFGKLLQRLLPVTHSTKQNKQILIHIKMIWYRSCLHAHLIVSYLAFQ